MICFVLTYFLYFAIMYDVEFDNLSIILLLPQIYLMPILLIILFLPQIYLMPILLYFFMRKAT